MTPVFDPIQKTGEAWVGPCAAGIVIIEPGISVTDLRPKQRRPLRAENDIAVIAHIISGDSLKSRERVARAQNVRLLPNNERITQCQIVAFVENMVELRVENVGGIRVTSLSWNHLVIPLVGIHIP